MEVFMADDRKNFGMNMTEKEIEKFMDECVSHTESNHPHRDNGDYMAMALEGAESYYSFLEKQKKRNKP